MPQLPKLASEEIIAKRLRNTSLPELETMLSYANSKLSISSVKDLHVRMDETYRNYWLTVKRLTEQAIEDKIHYNFT